MHHDQESSNPGHPWLQWAVVLLLTFAYSISIIDKMLVNLVVDDIKQNLFLSDVQIGVITGNVLGLLTLVTGVAAGYMADTRNRRRLILASTTCWSVMTALTAFSQGFWSLYWTRVGISLGDVLLLPACYSLISDMFSKQQLPRATGLLYVGAALGPGVAMLFGGVAYGYFAQIGTVVLPAYGVIEHWRSVLIASAVPGFILTALIFLFLKEPRRMAGEEKSQVKFRDVFVWLKARARFFGSLTGAVIAFSIYFTGLLGWMAVYLGRSFGWAPSRSGLLLGAVFLTFGVFGPLFGGFYVNRMRLRGIAQAPMKAMLRFGFISFPLSIMTTLLGNPYLSIVSLALAVFFMMAMFSIAPLILQVSAPPQMRGQVSAIYFALVNTIAGSIGPLLTGAIAQYGLTGAGSIGNSLAIVAVSVFPVGVLAIHYATRVAPRENEPHSSPVLQAAV